MVNKARELLKAFPICEIHHAEIESWAYPSGKYDLVISRLALHYVEELGLVFSHIREALTPNGRFVFSVQHPVLTASLKSASSTGKRADWIVDDYFETGKRSVPWIGEVVVKYHRTIEDYFQAVTQAGFKVTDLRECAPIRELFESEEEYRRRRRIPLFLMFQCAK